MAAGKLDIVCGITTPTWDREALVDFSVPFFRDGTRILIYRERATGGVDLGQIDIGVVEGTTTVNIISEALPTANLRLFGTMQDAMAALAARAEPRRSVVLLPRTYALAMETLACVLPQDDKYLARGRQPGSDRPVCRRRGLQQPIRRDLRALVRPRQRDLLSARPRQQELPGHRLHLGALRAAVGAFRRLWRAGARAAGTWRRAGERGHSAIPSLMLYCNNVRSGRGGAAEGWAAERMDTLPGERPTFHEGGHEHQTCIEDALARAEALCRRRGARLTPLRRRVLELVWGSHRAVKAYDLLAALGDTAGTAKPPTVYRALEFLIEHGLVHRIDSLNAFVGCAQPDERHSAQFLICGGCGEVSEMNAASIDRAAADQAAESGFALSRSIIELHGRCPRCTTRSPSA